MEERNKIEMLQKLQMELDSLKSSDDWYKSLQEKLCEALNSFNEGTNPDLKKYVEDLQKRSLEIEELRQDFNFERLDKEAAIKKKEIYEEKCRELEKENRELKLKLQKQSSIIKTISEHDKSIEEERKEVDNVLKARKEENESQAELIKMLEVHVETQKVIIERQNEFIDRIIRENNRIIDWNAQLEQQIKKANTKIADA